MDDLVGDNAANLILFGTRMKRAIFGAFFKMQSKMRLGQKYFYFSTIIMTLQLIYFTLARRVNLPWSNVIESSISNFFEIYNYSFYRNEPEWAIYLQMGISTVLTLFGSGGIALLAYESAIESNEHAQLVPFVEVSLRLLQTILLIPSVGVFIEMIQCPQTLGACAISGTAIILQIFGSICLLLLVVLSSMNALLMVQFSLFEEDGKVDHGCFGAPHGRVELANTWIRLILAITLASFPTNNIVSLVGQMIWISMLTISGILLVTMYSYYLPFLNTSWNKFCVGSYSCFLWACFALLVCTIIDNPDDLTARVLYILVLPMFLFALLSWTDFRIRRLIKPNEKASWVRSQWLCEVRLRFMYVRPDATSALFTFDKKVEESFKDALNQFPTSAYLHLHAANLCSISKRLVLALHFIRKAKQNRMAFDNQFMLYCLNRRNIEENKKLSGAAAFMTFDSQITAARASIVSTLKHTSKFWKALSKGRYTSNELIEHGAMIHRDAKHANENISKLLNMGRSNKETLRLYATYVNCVLNDQAQAQKILDRHSNDTSANEGFAVCMISGNMDTLGIVLEATSTVCSLFGYSKSDIVGRSINNLIPPPLDRIHDDVMRHFITADEDLTTQTKSLFGLNSDGYIFPMELTITPSTNDESDLIFIGQFKALQNSAKHILMVDGNSLIVTGCTCNAPSTLNFDMDEVFAMSMHLSNIVPDFFSDDNGHSHFFSKDPNHMVTINGSLLHIEARKIFYKKRDISNNITQASLIIVTFLAKYCDEQGGSTRPVEEEDTRSCDTSESEQEIDTFDSNDENFLVDDDAAVAPLLSRPSFSQKQQSFRQELFRNSANAKSTRSLGKFSRQLSNNASRSSLGSNSDASQGLTIAQIHRLIDFNLKMKDPRMKQFGRFVLLFSVGFVILAIIRVAAVSSWYQTFAIRSDQMFLAFQRTQELVAVNTLVEILRNPVVNVLNQSFERLLPVNIVDSFTVSLEELHIDHEKLVGSLVDSADNHARLFYLSNISQTQDALFENVSYHMFMLHYMEHIENYMTTDRFLCKDSCFYILNNGPFSLNNESIKHSEFYFRDTLTVLDNIAYVAFVSVWFVFILLGIAFVIGFVPMFQLTQKRKRIIAEAFMSIPLHTMRMLRRRTDRRIKMVQSENIIVNDLTLDEDENDEEADDEFCKVTPGIKREKSKLFASMEETTSWWRRCCLRKRQSAYVDNLAKSTGKISPDPSSATKQVLRRESRMSKSLMYLTATLRVAFIFWYVMLFFCFISYVDFVEIPNIRATTAELHIAGMREILISGLYFWAIQDFNNTREGFRADYTDQVATFQWFFNTAKVYDDALMLGSTEYNVRNFKDTSGVLYDLYFGNACSAKCEEASQFMTEAMQNPDMSMAKDLKHGLVLALQRYWLIMEEIISAKTALQEDYSDVNLIALYEAQRPIAALPLFVAFAHVLEEGVNQYNENLNSLVASIRALKILVLVLFCIFIFFVYYLTVRVYRQMDRELKNSQTLLYMLPLEVFEDVKEMRALIHYSGKSAKAKNNMK